MITEIDNDLGRLIHRVYTEEKQNATGVSVPTIPLNGFVQEHSSYNTSSEESIRSLGIDDVAEDEKTTKKNNIKTRSQTDSVERNDINGQHEVNNKTDSDIFESQDSLEIGIKQGNVDTSMHEIQNNDEYFDNDKIKFHENENENESAIEKDDNINKMTSAIMESCLHRKGDEQHDPLAFCWLWDFAGEKDYYATHQVFLSTCAVYLLVTDSLEFSTAKMLWTDIEDSARKVLNSDTLLVVY